MEIFCPEPFSNILFADVKPFYFVENGRLHCKPYHFTYKTYCKERWIGSTLSFIFEKEFRDKTKDYYLKSIKIGNIKINGGIVDADYKLKNNDLITHYVERTEPPVSPDKINILYESDDLLVVNKPSPMPVHPSGRYRFNTLIGILISLYGYKRLSLINRLDKSVSGIVIIAKNEKKAKLLHQSMESRNIRKEYICKVRGNFPSMLSCSEPIGIFDYKLCLNAVVSDGKPSFTSFENIYSNPFEGTSIIRAIPLTGRSHQIRVHLQYLGYPIVNDPIYGSNFWPQRKTIRPFTKEEINKFLSNHEHGRKMMDLPVLAFNVRNVVLAMIISSPSIYMHILIHLKILNLKAYIPLGQ